MQKYLKKILTFLNRLQFYSFFIDKYKFFFNYFFIVINIFKKNLFNKLINK